MKLIDWVEITKGIDEYDIKNEYCYFMETKDRMVEKFGEVEIEDIFIDTYDEGLWIVATIYLKKIKKVIENA